MTVTTKYYYGLPGQYKITDAALASVHIICVTRSGLTYYRSIISPGNLEYKYEAGPGSIVFDNSNRFSGPDSGPIIPSNLERISVKYKI